MPKITEFYTCIHLLQAQIKGVTRFNLVHHVSLRILWFKGIGIRYVSRGSVKHSPAEVGNSIAVLLRTHSHTRVPKIIEIDHGLTKLLEY